MRNPLAGIERGLFWTLAFAVFAAAAAGLAARAVERAALAYEESRSTYAIVRVEAPLGPEGMATAQAVLADARQVRRAAPMSAARAASLLEQWGGGAVAAEDIPPLQLIELELAPGHSGPTTAADLGAALARSGVTAQVIDAPDAGSGGGASALLRQIVLAGAGGFALVMVVIVALSARTLAARRRELIIVLCDLGATRGQAASRVGEEAALLGFLAGVVGAALAGAAAVVAILLAIPDTTLQTLPTMILPLDLVPLAAAPFIAGLAAAWGARSAAAGFHAQAARLG